MAPGRSGPYLPGKCAKSRRPTPVHAVLLAGSPRARYYRSMRVVLAAGLAILGCNPPPEVRDGGIIAEDTATGQHEPTVKVTPPLPPDAVLPIFPHGLVYMSNNSTLAVGAVSSSPQQPTQIDWLQSRSWILGDNPTLPGCLEASPPNISDPVIVVSRRYSPTLLTHPAFLAMTNGAGAPEGLAILRPGALGLISSGMECWFVDINAADQPTMAWMPADPQNQLPERLVGRVIHELETGGGGHLFLSIPIEDGINLQTNSTAQTVLPQPSPDIGTDFTRCSLPSQGFSERGRGNITEGRGNIYHAYTNYYTNTQLFADPTPNRRVYVERIADNGSIEWSLCLDESVLDAKPFVTSQRYFDLGDPSIGYDARSRRIFVTYPRRKEGEAYREIILAHAVASQASSPDAWTFLSVVEDSRKEDYQGDRGQAALAVTQFTSDDDVPERLASGVVYVTWYGPGLESPTLLPNVVVRRARGYRFQGPGNLVPRSASFDISDVLFPNVTNPAIEVDTLNSPRGVHEYQGVAHIPGTSDWVGVWAAPLPGLSNPANPSSLDFRTYHATWD